jgi:hypothetical protein
VSNVFASFPKSIRIGPFTIPVFIKDMPKDEEGRILFGQYTALGVIELSTIAPNPVHAADTVIHEVLHGLYGNAGLGPMCQEEQVVSALSTGLVQVFRDNPKLVAWLTKALRAKK